MNSDEEEGQPPKKRMRKNIDTPMIIPETFQGKSLQYWQTST